MRRALCAVLLGVVIAGCGGDDDSTQPAAARLGDTLSLDTSDTTVDVTVTGVSDPAEVGRFDRPQTPGARFVGVEVELANTGEGTFGGALFLSGSLIDDVDREASIATPAGGPCAGEKTTDVQIAPGDERAACFAFELADGAQPTRFQFSVDSGNEDPNTAEWELR